MATSLTPAARWGQEQSDESLTEQWKKILPALPAWAAKIGQRPAMPTQEEVMARNLARQANWTLKEGQGGQTAAGIRRMQSGQPGNALPLETAMEERWRKMTAPGAPVLRPAAATPTAPTPRRSLAGTGPGSNMPFPIPPEVAKRGQRNVQMAGLMDEGFGLLSQQPGARDAISGGLNLGPNNILVRERLGTPEDYTAALQARDAVMARGQAAGMPQSVIGGDYRPSEATRMYAEQGGPITEYAVPGKGAATFLGNRQGGGTLSVVGGRTPEEQALINQRVAGIDSQTAAMRDLRNAQRLAQGLPTVEQAEQMAAMQRMMPAPPSTRDLDLQEAELMRQLQGAGDIRGFGSRRRRADAIQAAQTGLAAIANQRQALNQGYQAQLAQAQGLMGLQASERQKAIEAQLGQRAAEQERQQWRADFGLRQADLDLKTQEAQVKAQQTGNQLALDWFKSRRIDPEKTLTALSRFMSEPNPTTGERSVNFDGFNAFLGVTPLPASAEQIRPGTPYFDVKEKQYMIFDQDRNPIPIGGAFDLVQKMSQ